MYDHRTDNRNELARVKHRRIIDELQRVSGLISCVLSGH